ncbi:MAG: ATP-binding protein [Spirochaetes bacterium]|nr:MAG: ATP-binding protein [Spirochaetota bacterium]
MTTTLDTHNGTDVKAAVDAVFTEPYILKGKHTQRIVKLIDAAHAASLTPMLWGAPGVGKTALIHALAQRPGFGGAFVVLTGSQDKSDTLGMPSRSVHVDKYGVEHSVTVHATPRWALEANDADGTVYVFLDEFPQAEVDVQGTFLTVLQSRIMPSGVKIGDHVKFIAAGNPTDIVASGYELIEPLQNRLSHLKYAPPAEEWFEGMMDAWGVDVSEDEAQLRRLIVGYLIGKKGLLHEPPKPGEGDAVESNAWPSRRSWDNLSRMGAFLMDDKDALEHAATSLVGKAAAMDFVTTVFRLKSKTPAEIVADPSCVDWTNSLHGFVALASVVSWISSPADIAPAIAVFNTAVRSGPRDVAAQQLIKLTDAARRVKGDTKVFKTLDMSETGFKPFAHLLFGKKKEADASE